MKGKDFQIPHNINKIKSIVGKFYLTTHNIFKTNIMKVNNTNYTIFST